MKAKFFFFIFSLTMVTIVPSMVKGQTFNPTVQGYFKIEDDYGYEYNVWIEVRTSDPWSSGLIQLPDTYYANSGLHFFSRVFSKVPFPSPVPQNYYTIRIWAEIVGGGTPNYGSSYATPYLSGGIYYLDALDNIVVPM